MNNIDTGVLSAFVRISAMCMLSAVCRCFAATFLAERSLYRSAVPCAALIDVCFMGRAESDKKALLFAANML